MDQVEGAVERPYLPELISALATAGIYKSMPAIEAHAREAFFDGRKLAKASPEFLLTEALFAVVKARCSGQKTDNLVPILKALDFVVFGDWA